MNILVIKGKAIFKLVEREFDKKILALRKLLVSVVLCLVLIYHIRVKYEQDIIGILPYR